MPPAAPPPDRRVEALQKAAARVVAELAGVADWPARCARLGLPAPAADGALYIPFLGGGLTLRPPDFLPPTGAPPVAAAARLLALHYLRAECAVTPANEWVTFRDFPGGAFYWAPFVGRVIQPLPRRFGNRLDALRAALAPFAPQWDIAVPDQLQARVPALGPLFLQLIYRAGDDEFGPTADILFDAAFRRVLCAEDAAALAGLLTAALRP